MKIIFSYILLFSCSLIFAQGSGEANDKYINQSEINNLSDLNYDTICNSLVITSNCESDFPTLSSNQELNVDCIYDLNGETISLSDDVILNYLGGDIINGTLVFNGGKIDGRILNSSLKTEGNLELIDTIFQFFPSRWKEDIVQGEITVDVALKNNTKLEDLMFFTQSIGATTFKIDKFDAFFEIGTVTSTTSDQNFYPSREAVNLPSDFHLIMTENTHLRVFPNDAPKYSLLAVRNQSNVKITGGTLHGDRNEHIFTTGGTHEWGHCIELHAAVNTTVSGVTMIHGNGDGMKIHSLNFTFSDNYLPSHNIHVSNCIFESNRRNNLSITDGYDIMVEKNQFLNAGINTGFSDGTPPKFGIDIEAHRDRNDETGELILYEQAHHITIRDNIETGSQASGFGIFIGEFITIENNQIGTSISWGWTEGSIIRNNTIIAHRDDISAGILGGRSDNKATTFNNQVYGNFISGHGSGITIYGRENKIYDNDIENCINGIFARFLETSEIYDNTISSEKESSKGIFGNLTTIKDVDFHNNIINVTSNPYRFVNVNSDSSSLNYSFTVRDNDFNTPASSKVSNTYGLILENNQIEGNTDIENSTNIHISGNTIVSSSSSGLHLREVNSDIKISNNDITVPNTGTCIRINSTVDMNEITESDNTCSND